jgi:hypothetical protein
MLFKKLYAKLPVLLSLQSNRKIQSVARDSVFVGKEWLLQELRKTLAKVMSQLDHPFLRAGAHPYAPIFYKCAAITIIYTSNKLERTLPLPSSAHDT